MQPNTQASQGAPAKFGTTHWSVVLAAARTRSPEAEEALEKLCLGYWYPLYAYARRKGVTPAEAQDLTQSFFAEKIVTRLIFKGVEPSAGKFRTWLLNSFQNFIHNQWEQQNAQKRGGGRECLSLDFQDAEGKYLLEPAHEKTPEKLYDRAWVMTLLERVLEQVRENYDIAGKRDWFDALVGYLPGALAPTPYCQKAAQLGKTEAAVKMDVSRLKREYAKVLEAEIRRTLSENGNPDEERRHLFAILAE